MREELGFFALLAVLLTLVVLATSHACSSAESDLRAGMEAEVISLVVIHDGDKSAIYKTIESREYGTVRLHRALARMIESGRVVSEKGVLRLVAEGESP